MKKFFLTVPFFLIAFLFSNTLNAQTFEKGDFNIGAGIGLGSTLGGGTPIAIHAEYGITEDISLGGYGSFASYSSGYAGFNYKWTYTVIGARASYHFNTLLDLPEKFDVYGGLGLYNYGVKVTTSSGSSYSGPLSDGIHFGAHVGGRYYFTDNLAAFVDLGNGIAYFQTGISYKL